MGHREDLLVGARKCLYEKGYARTTTRDIVRASNTNLASIGYHYGSKEALLNAALKQAIGEWGVELYQVIAEAESDADPFVRFESTWNKILDMFDKHRQSWAANFEVFAQVDHVPAVRAAQAEGLSDARKVLGAMFADAAPVEGQSSVGSFYQALIIGVMAQWLIDPDNAPSGADLTEALRIIVGGAKAGTKTKPKAAAGAAKRA
jgi:AcrR family transcriptional regulator